MGLGTDDLSMVPEKDARDRIQGYLRDKVSIGDVVFVAFLDKVIRVERKGPNSLDFRYAKPDEVKIRPEIRQAMNQARQLDGQTPTTCNDCLLVPNAFQCWMRARHNMKLYCFWMQTDQSRAKKIEKVKVRIESLSLESGPKPATGGLVVAAA